MVKAEVDEILAAHRRAGRFFVADGIRSFALEAGDGPPVLCVHGVPASSFLYRKVVPELASRGLRGVAVDLPGLGLADRPVDADYTWSGLGRWLTAAIDELALERCHLLLHDIGGPVGFEVANALPDRVLSMTLLNTIGDVASFHRPWPMEPFAHKLIGEAWLASLRLPYTFTSIMRLVGVSRQIPTAELECWVPLLFGDDNGRAFLKIMRGFELTTAKRDLYGQMLGAARYPIQIVWGSKDTMLPWRRHGVALERTARVKQSTMLPAKHFVPEDFPGEVADAIQRLARR
ncbi:haloalkane dehalogenase [Mycobacterium sp. ACS1612]|uniref:alpha/beta fold hydrolase n=1 Tax=Mycobacterium sp. ACS1612 TaxID=1834117 RepID=UPI0007FC2D9D|nr:alpha/beta hydrolase [Mycobacterium sp. ACS1612]OBF26074.1 haloalkane dehalogenase [Mycobacterium sp. ACS1612]